jgi:hypothetical protein
LPFNFTFDNLKGICSLSAGDPQASPLLEQLLDSLPRLLRAGLPKIQL